MAKKHTIALKPEDTLDGSYRLVKYYNTNLCLFNPNHYTFLHY